MGKKRKCYFNNNSAAAKKTKLKFGNTLKLEPNMKGFLITYNCKFTFVINEAKKLLQQFSSPNEAEKGENEKSKGSDDGDIEKLLKQELDSLNSRDKELRVIDTGAKYTIFIKLDSVDTNQVVRSIFQFINFKHIEATKKPVGRYVQRLLPVLNTCKAHLEDIEKCLKTSFDQLEAIKNCAEDGLNKPFTYSCVFKASNNGSLSRDEIFKTVGVYLNSKNKLNKVNFDNPDYVVLIQVICNICFISFLDNFFNFRKYNLIEMGAKFIPKGDDKVKEIKESSEQLDGVENANVTN